jgi:endogenous inhibitor of DNA gyrase (YacG/DUF329 family)
MYSKEDTRIENAYRVYTGLTYNGICVYCRDTFKSRSIAAKYCSQRCRNDVQIERRAEIAFKKRENLKNCIVCNLAITQTKTAKLKKYCSQRCKQKAYRTKNQ